MTLAAPKRGFEGLRHFVRKWQPAVLLLHTEVGDRQIALKDRQMREQVSAAISMRPVGMIEALDSKGALLATFDTSRLEQQEDSPIIPTSALQSDMQLVSRLLGDAYRHALETMRIEHETHSTSMVRLVEIAFKRLEQIEASWGRMHRARVAELERQEEHGGGEPSLEEQVVGSLIGGIARGAVEQAQQTAANGAPTKTPNGKGGKH